MSGQLMFFGLAILLVLGWFDRRAMLAGRTYTAYMPFGLVAYIVLVFLLRL